MPSTTTARSATHRNYERITQPDTGWCFPLLTQPSINNLAYVVILSAALDIVGPHVPKGTVLLANILPSLAVKLTMPYAIHYIPYSLIIAWSPSIAVSMVGIITASASSGLGEMSWLMLTSLYHPLSVSAFSSGTGAAGVLGAVSFLAMTSWLGWTMRTSLIILSVGRSSNVYGFTPPL
ncbi:CLN3 protein-domain-containing protein [Syncephalis plumigaleata]|nr:CLN3 protein-domain-containing protein [Syncephalis plumigaleata]